MYTGIAEYLIQLLQATLHPQRTQPAVLQVGRPINSSTALKEQEILANANVKRATAVTI